MKINFLSIILLFSLSFCMKANLNNFADPAQGTGILYGYSFAPITQLVQEIIPVATSIETANFPATIDNGATINNLEIKFNKEIETDTTITIRSLDSSIKINNLSEVTLNFTKANSRTAQIFSITATSVLLIDPDITIEFESPLVLKTTKIIKIMNTANQQAIVVKDIQGTQLSNSLNVNARPGDQFTYAITLKYKPTANSTITLSNGGSQATIGKTEIIFTPDNYNIPQSFTITLPGISDNTNTNSNTVSYYASAEINGISTGDFVVQYFLGSFSPTIVITGPTTLNKGDVVNYGVSLSHKPDANRTVTVSLSQSKFLSLNKTTFSFTPANYNTPQTLQMTVSSLDYIYGEVTATFATTGGYYNGTTNILVNDTNNSVQNVSDLGLLRYGAQAIAIDSINSKLLIASNGGYLRISSSVPPSNILHLSICNLDGTSCVHKDISAMTSQGDASGYIPSMVIDTVNSKILISTYNIYNNMRPYLFRCNLDGSSCSHIDVSAGRGDLTSVTPKLLLDTANNKILLLTKSSGTNVSRRLSLFRCNLDGTGCAYTDISAGMGDNSTIADRIAAGIDTANSKLLVVTRNGFATNTGKPSLFRCNLDGSGCTYTDISAGQDSNSGIEPSMAIDSANGKLFVTTSNSNLVGGPSVFKCNLDGTSCTHTKLATTSDEMTTYRSTIFLDQANAKVLVAVSYTLNNQNFYPGLYRCSLDMTGCTFNNLALNGGALAGGNTPDIIIDTISAIPRILVGLNGLGSRSTIIRILRNFVD